MDTQDRQDGEGGRKIRPQTSDYRHQTAVQNEKKCQAEGGKV